MIPIEYLQEQIDADPNGETFCVWNLEPIFGQAGLSIRHIYRNCIDRYEIVYDWKPGYDNYNGVKTPYVKEIPQC